MDKFGWLDEFIDMAVGKGFQIVLGTQPDARS
jgi:beta-galactosidase GanA